MPVRTTNGRNMRELFVYILMALMLAGCEVISPDNKLIPVTPKVHGGARNHVLLEFTGFRCVNCPTAAEIAQDLEKTYEGRLILVSLHPASNPFTQGLYDYTCPAADSVYKYLGGTASTPFPAGNLNIRSYEGEKFVNMSEWPTMVYNAMQDTLVPALDQAEVSYWLVEDSILGVQAMPDGTIDMAYYHRHVLRDIQADKADLTIPEGSNPAQLYLITVYSDSKDKHIIQAYEEKYIIGN